MLEDNAALQDDIVDTSDEDMEKLEKNLVVWGRDGPGGNEEPKKCMPFPPACHVAP